MEELNLYTKIILYLFKSRKFKQEEKKSPHQYAMECINLLHLDKYARKEIISIISLLINEKNDITKQEYDSAVKKLKKTTEKDVDEIVKYLRGVEVRKV